MISFFVQAKRLLLPSKEIVIFKKYELFKQTLILISNEVYVFIFFLSYNLYKIWNYNNINNEQRNQKYGNSKYTVILEN